MHDGKLPVCSDRLHSLQMTGMIRAASFFSSHVGTGSSKHDVGGADAIMD